MGSHDSDFTFVGSSTLCVDLLSTVIDFGTLTHCTSPSESNSELYDGSCPNMSCPPRSCMNWLYDSSISYSNCLLSSALSSSLALIRSSLSRQI